MIRLRLIFASLAAVVPFGADAAWYGNHAVPYLDGSAGGVIVAQPCDDDADGIDDTPYVRAASDNLPDVLVPSPANAPLLGLTENGQVQCLWWDAQSPNDPTSVPLSAIKNSDASDCGAAPGFAYCKTHTVNFSVTAAGSPDTGGSGEAHMDIEVRSSPGNALIYSASSVSFTGLNARPFSATLADGEYIVRARAVDRAGNASAFVTSSTRVVVDTVPPDWSELAVSPANGTNVLATDSFQVSFVPSFTSGAPFKSVSASMEKFDDYTSFYPVAPLGPTGTLNVSLVDGPDRQATGGRPYTLNLSGLCDFADNCVGGSHPYVFNVYADARPARVVAGVSAPGMSDGTAVADGTAHALTVTVKDPYGNGVVRAPGIGRTLSFSLGGTNTAYMDQLRRSGGSAAFVSAPEAPGTYTPVNFSPAFAAPFAPMTFADQLSSDGTYPFSVKVFAPIDDARSGIKPSDFQSRLTLAPSYSFVDGQPTYASDDATTIARADTHVFADVAAKFKPLYDLTFFKSDYREAAADTVATGPHDSTVATAKNSAVTPSVPAFLAMLTVPVAQSDRFTMRHGVSDPASLTTTVLPYGSSPSAPPSDMGVDPASAPQSVTWYSDVTQSGSAEIGSAVISLHVTYALDGHDVAYNGDVLNRPSYWETGASAASRQMAAKITGMTANTQGYQAVDGDQQQGILVLGNASKFASKSSVRTRSYALARSAVGAASTVHPVTFLSADCLADGATCGWGTYLKNAGVLLFEPATPGDTVTVDNGGTIAASGRATLLVVGGNVYIKSNISTAADPSASIGIVAVADENGNGGNVYVDPGVTNIDAAIYADRALISYDGSEMGGDTRATHLKNQLLIYGSVLSENTLGGSLKPSELKCPYFVPTGACDLATARKYDLNYLRRYRLTDDALGKKVPAWNALAAGGASCSPVCSPTSLRSPFANTDTGPGSANDASGPKYALYPLIVQYNPRLQANPPPVFDAADAQ